MLGQFSVDTPRHVFDAVVLNSMTLGIRALVKSVVPKSFVVACRSLLTLDSAPSNFHFAEKGDIAFKRGKLSDILMNHEGKFVGKWVHYVDIYESLLSEISRQIAEERQSQSPPIRILEIGVSEGGSLEVWKKYFGDSAIVFGIDINPDCLRHQTDGVYVRIGSQSDPDFLTNVILEMGKPDLIIDDGSHRGVDQEVSFKALWPCLSDGGMYIVEDLHTAYWSEFGDGYGKKSSFIEFSKEIVDSLHSRYTRRKLPKRVRGLEEDIHSVTFYDSIVVMRKRRRPKPERVGFGG